MSSGNFARQNHSQDLYIMNDKAETQPGDQDYTPDIEVFSKDYCNYLFYVLLFIIIPFPHCSSVTSWSLTKLLAKV